MASDLEALFEHYLAQGLPEEEAASRAERKVLASPAEVQRLVAVHASGAQRWLGWLFGRVRRDLDLFLVLVGVFPVLGLAAAILVPQLPRLGASPFLWIEGAIGGAIAALALFKTHQLFLRRDPGLEALRKGLSGLLFLGLMAPGVAGLGFLVRAHALSLRLSAGGGGPDWIGAAEELGRGATLLGCGILLAIAAGFLWFVLANRLAALERAERRLLLDE